MARIHPKKKQTAEMILVPAHHNLERVAASLTSHHHSNQPHCNPSLTSHQGQQFEALAFGSTALCGRPTFWYWLISAVPFYCATWEHYFTNTLILPAINEPTEGLMLIYLVHFFTAIVGVGWWPQQFGTSPIFESIPKWYDSWIEQDI